MNSPPDRSRAGALFALVAFGAWGLNPVYFKAVAGIPPLEVLSHRITWSVVLLLPLVVAGGRWRALVRAAANRRVMRLLLVTTLMLALNWLLYIWTVDSGQVLQASLGYYITPLVNIAAGVLLLGERLSRLRQLASALAVAAVAVLAWAGGGVPWIALVLAVSFGAYGFMRKIAAVESLEGLLLETLLLVPAALGWLVWLAVSGTGRFGSGHGTGELLLMLSGPVTALPLVWFAAAARRLRLSVLGFFQYLAPTGQLLLAVLAYGEPFGPARMAAFALIWAALLLVSLESWRARRARGG
ncbi:MAG: EamA family transporter RarD [Dongiaceae bacterium]